MRKLMFLVLPIALLFAGTPAQASTIQVGSAGALGANDFFDWGQYVDGALQGSPLGATSNLGRGATLTARRSKCSMVPPRWACSTWAA